MSRAQARKERRRGDYLAALGTVVAAIALGAVVMGFMILSRQLAEANQARDQLAAQVQGLGAEPVAGPPGSRGDSGLAGPRGPRGKAGPPGEDAPTVKPSPGPPGEAGKDGKDGRNGRDSTVPGPTGPPGDPGQNATGEPGPAGKDGKDGADGKDGSNGKDGDAGKPPTSWTFSYGGSDYTCRQADDFDPDAPRYTCETDQPQPSPSDGSNGIPAVIDPSRKRS